MSADLKKSDLTRLADRKRYQLIIDKYLRDMYAQRTVARVSELADLLGTPPSYLSRIIPQLFGKSLRAILLEKRIEEAKRLLRVTPLGIAEVAAASAFGHRSTFHRLFRNAVGMSPAEYRQKVMNCDFTRE